MASTKQKTASTHRSVVVRGTHEFHIVGCSDRKRFAGVTTSSPIKSGSFLAGGHAWALACSFDDQGHLASITLELLLRTKDDVVATAGIRIEDPLGECPPAVWRSDDANRFQQTTKSGRSWELSVPDAYHGNETRYVRDDRLTIQCTVDVFKEYSPDVGVETRNCFVSVVPPPTIGDDLHKLLHVGDTEERRRRCTQPDVTFIVEDIEIQAHKLVLAMRSPVFAAEFRWHTNESASTLRIGDMSASTFRAMLRFIYTDELPIKASNDTAPSVMGTLLLVRGRETCRQLEDSCIDYIASGPEVYAAVMATEEYQELKNSCSPLILEIMERVAMACNSSSDGIRHGWLPQKSWSSYNASEEAHGVHEFRIPNFCAVQRSHGAGQMIKSGTFQVGGHDWMLEVYPSGDRRDDERNISVYLRLLSHPPPDGVRVFDAYMVDDPSEKSLLTVSKKRDFTSIYTRSQPAWGYAKLITLESAKSQYLAHDGSLTIYAGIAVTKEPFTRSTPSIPTTWATINVPSSSIALQLEQLLVSEEGSDVRFLVEGTEILAHRLVIAARSPILYEAVAAAGDNNAVCIKDVKAKVFKAVLHFVYTDELATIGTTKLVGKHMLAAASRFRLERMKIICENYLAEHISQDNAFDTLKLACRHRCSKLKDYCMDFILSVPILAKDVMGRILLLSRQHRQGRRRGRRHQDGETACPVPKRGRQLTNY